MARGIRKSVQAITEQLDPNEAFRQILNHDDIEIVWELIGPLLQHHLKAKPLGHVLAYTFIEGFECGALKNAYWYGKTPGEGWTKEALEDFGFRERQPEKPVIATNPPHDHPPVPRDLLTPEQAADYLQIAPATLAIWRGKTGKQAIPFVKVGRAVRYRRSDLIEWLNTRQAKKMLSSSVDRTKSEM
jgi:excisionase family DNA binding protein